MTPDLMNMQASTALKMEKLRYCGNPGLDDLIRGHLQRFNDTDETLEPDVGFSQFNLADVRQADIRFLGQFRLAHLLGESCLTDTRTDFCGTAHVTGLHNITFLPSYKLYMKYQSLFYALARDMNIK
jgi:hypothetical protein